MNQSINTDSKNSKEPQQKYRLGTVSIKILGSLNRFYRRLTSPSASIMKAFITVIKNKTKTRLIFLKMTTRDNYTNIDPEKKCLGESCRGGSALTSPKEINFHT